VSLLHVRSRVEVDEAGWTWLRPDPASTRIRHSTATFVLAVLVLAGMAAYSFLVPAAAVVVVGALVVAGLALVVRTARSANTRAAVSELGVVLQTGTHLLQAGWPALDAVIGTRVGARVRLTVEAGGDRTTGSGTFEEQPARAWLERCAAEAARRNLDPQPLPDALGFRGGHKP
jgi:hypothetical protein